MDLTLELEVLPEENLPAGLERVAKSNFFQP